MSTSSAPRDDAIATGTNGEVFVTFLQLGLTCFGSVRGLHAALRVAAAIVCTLGTLAHHQRWPSGGAAAGMLMCEVPTTMLRVSLAGDRKLAAVTLVIFVIGLARPWWIHPHDCCKRLPPSIAQDFALP